MTVLSTLQSRSGSSPEFPIPAPLVAPKSSWGRSLWHTINESQRHPITDFHNDAYMNTVGDRIKWVRGKRGMERKDLVKASGVPYPTLAGIENGDQKSSTELPALAAALRTPIAFLQTGRGEWDATKSFAGTDMDARFEGIRVAQTLMATVLARSIPDAARALHKALEKPARHDEYLTALRAAIDNALPPLSLPAPTPQAPAPSGRKRP